MATDVNLGMLTLEELRQLLGSGQQSTPYSQIMGQTGGGDPYSQIMAQMPVLQNPYANAYYGPTGGYIPRMSSDATARAIRQLGFGGDSQSGSGSSGSDPTSNPFGDLTPAERAAYYTENPNMGTITQLGQKALGFTSLGALSKAMNPGFFSNEGLISMGVNPDAYQAAKEGFRASEIADMNVGYGGYAPSTETGVGNPGESYAGGFTSSDTGIGNPGESYGGNTSSDTGVGNPGESSGGGDSGGYGSGDSSGFGGGTDSGGDGYAKGGKVTKDRLKGPDPKGPDEGYGALLSGEYVIKKSAVDKYGTGLLNMINNGKIPAKKIKSLLG